MDLTPIYRIEHFLDAIVNNSVNPYSPEYRVEYYLAKIAGENVTIPEPTYRIEFYLAYLCGEEVELPNPIYRIEYYLAFLCGLNVELPEPVYRIEFWLWDWCGGGGIEKTITGNPIHITDALAKPVQALSIALEPVQAGSGDPSPDNVRPISGHTDADVTRTGKNLLDMYGKPGANIISKNVYLKAGTYTLSATGINGNYATYVRKATTEGSISGDIIASKVSEGNLTFTLSADTAIVVQWYCPNDSSADLTGKTFQLELGSTASDYSPYVGTTYPIPLGQTVYGGQLEYVRNCDSVSLRFAGTHAYTALSLNANTWREDPNRAGVFYGGLSGRKASSDIAMCNMYQVRNIGVSTNFDNYISGAPSYGGGVLFIRDTSYAGNLAAFQTHLNDVYIVYELETPFEISLAPEEITLLEGENNLWSDGTMTLVYLADGNASDVEALNILLGGRYVNNHEADEPTDREALDIVLGGKK